MCKGKSYTIVKTPLKIRWEAITWEPLPSFNKSSTAGVPPTLGQIAVSPVRLRRSRGLCLGVTLCDSHRDPVQPGAHTRGHVGPEERSWLGAGTLQNQGCSESPCPTISPLGWGCAHVFSQVELS